MAELEARATEICTFQTHMVHGLLQTEAYARAVLGAMDETNLDDRTTVRLARQGILEKKGPPVLWAILSEAALRQVIGGPEVMRGQLTHLLSFENDPRVFVQVLPFGAGAHAGLTGSNLYRFASDPDILYTEAMGWGTRLPIRRLSGTVHRDLARKAGASAPGGMASLARRRGAPELSSLCLDLNLTPMTVS